MRFWTAHVEKASGNSAGVSYSCGVVKIRNSHSFALREVRKRAAEQKRILLDTFIWSVQIRYYVASPVPSSEQPPPLPLLPQSGLQQKTSQNIVTSEREKKEQKQVKRHIYRLERGKERETLPPLLPRSGLKKDVKKKRQKERASEEA